MVDSPSWILNREAVGGKEHAAAVERRIWGTSPSSIEGRHLFLSFCFTILMNAGGTASATSSIFEAGSVDSDDEEHISPNHPLLSEPADGSQAHVVHAQGSNTNVKPLSLPTVLLHTPGDVRRPMIIVSFVMLGQQLSGINAILYYSNDILSKSLPDLAAYISLGVTIVNVIMTFPPIFLIEVPAYRASAVTF